MRTLVAEGFFLAPINPLPDTQNIIWRVRKNGLPCLGATQALACANLGIAIKPLLEVPIAIPFHISHV